MQVRGTADATAVMQQSEEGLEVPVLHMFAEHNMVDRARAVLAHGGIDLDEKDATHGVTALMLACAHGSRGMVELLLEFGASADAADADGATALMWAEGLGSTECAAILRKAGADAQARDKSGLSVADMVAGDAAAVPPPAAPVDPEAQAAADAPGGADPPRPPEDQAAVSSGMIVPPSAQQQSGVLWSEEPPSLPSQPVSPASRGAASTVLYGPTARSSRCMCPYGLPPRGACVLGCNGGAQHAGASGRGNGRRGRRGEGRQAVAIIIAIGTRASVSRGRFLLAGWRGICGRSTATTAQLGGE